MKRTTHMVDNINNCSIFFLFNHFESIIY